MDETVKEILKKNGVDVAGTISRFMGNEALLERFLKKFLDDNNFTQLKDNLDKKDYTVAFRYAHTLKGITANLGLNSLYHTLIEMTDDLRNGTPVQVDELFLGLEKDYLHICEIIKEHIS